MRILTVVVIVGAVALGSYVSAQDTPTAPKPVYTATVMRARISGDLRDRCVVLPDKTERLVNTTVTVDGKSYRCVEVLDWNFQRVGVAWTPVQQP
jgi:hypothetical protein